MAEVIKLQRQAPFSDYGDDGHMRERDWGEAYLVDDVEPLLAELAELREFRDRAAVVISEQLAEVVALRRELAELRERARMRLPDDGSHDGDIVWLAYDEDGAVQYGRAAVSLESCAWYLIGGGKVRKPIGWWPLPEVAG